jgi:hypothetical protein
MKTTVAIFEILPLYATIAVVGATMVAIAVTIMHLRADDRADRQAAYHAGRDLTVFRERRLGRNSDSQRQSSNGSRGNNFHHGLILYQCL